ncbi:uncharacterized protein KY384_008279 [Bacidia gigantensis]|uniref:uncharacterized protein n=1 Tax=Bacidia gigantensis TaxID=2732470 RepID=UPI001D04AE3D|nr:uncharacterized protein KY384_008279 [Bacidia gigantensis]KAG8526850.1 hypothetical protein KY384_008279 [Bacidia gigantensis]
MGRFQTDKRASEILFDHSPMPDPPLFKRQFDFGSTTSTSHKATHTSSSAAASATASQIDAPSPTASSSDDEGTSTNGIISAQPTGDNLPKAFDGGLGTNYTQPACVEFLKDLIRNDTVNSCLPVSLFLQNSQSFFTASRLSSTLDPVISASCYVVPQACAAVMANWALRMRSSSACSQDYDRQQPTVRQAYNGLISYQVTYSAICMKAVPSAANNQSSDYCYTNAVTNTSSPTDVYPYYLPLGVSLPAGSLPTCSKCLQDTMGMFADVARNKSSPLSITYVDAAQQINIACGNAFVNATPPGVKAASAANTLAASIPSVGFVALTTVVLAAMEVVGLL